MEHKAQAEREQYENRGLPKGDVADRIAELGQVRRTVPRASGEEHVDEQHEQRRRKCADQAEIASNSRSGRQCPFCDRVAGHRVPSPLWLAMAGGDVDRPRTIAADESAVLLRHNRALVLLAPPDSLRVAVYP